MNSGRDDPTQCARKPLTVASDAVSFAPVSSGRVRAMSSGRTGTTPPRSHL